MTVIALLQLDPTVGDIAGNVAMVEAAAAKAANSGAEMAVASELVISGYPPRDMLMDERFVSACEAAAMAVNSPIPLLIGTPLSAEKDRQKPFNGAVRVADSRTPKVVGRKQLLPTYDVFDEGRYFQADDAPGIDRSLQGVSIGITICEDAWQHIGEVPSDYPADPIEQLATWQHQGEPMAASVNLSSSPYHLAKEGVRARLVRKAASTLGHPFLLCNQVGGNDDLLFDGRSIVGWPEGTVVQGPAWCSGILLVDLEKPEAARWISLDEVEDTELQIVGPESEPIMPSKGQDLLSAVTLGLADYCRKSRIGKIVLGMSGGIDSAVCAAIACQAIGAGNVLGLAMPSRHSSDHSIEDAKATAEALGMELQVLPINEIHASVDQTLHDELESGHSVAKENLQARIRGTLVMGAANARGAMAIATGNKSELAMGYCTLYGDMNGGYAPLGDLYKTEVYEVAHAINENSKGGNPITESTMTKPPSAELAPDQKDEDNLPPYTVLDPILEDWIELGIRNDSPLTTSVLSRLHANEHKRWQLCPAPRVSNRAFGQGWRQPLASRR
ncbi:MAG: Glutamine-dependent NAD(+) synthetase [Marine Group II euryarchaeote MED-G33]|nr:MAG: Glutamine-dependent NAD(+) synthetase [Marine Group II euryarchaeote MED-G33]